jgi:hypothetical protein
MKITKTQLRELIREEIKNVSEDQTSSGVINLSKKLYDVLTKNGKVGTRLTPPVLKHRISQSTIKKFPQGKGKTKVLNPYTKKVEIYNSVTTHDDDWYGIEIELTK